MTRHLLLASSLIAAAWAAPGCKKSNKQEASSATSNSVPEPAARAGSAAASGADSAGKAVAAVQGTIDQGRAQIAAVGKAGLTAEVYEKLILGLEGCSIKELDVDDKCPGMITLREAMKQTSTALGNLVGLNAAVGKKLIGHAAPAVRLYATGLLGGVLGTDTSAEDSIVDAAAKEADPGVLQKMIRTVANAGAKNPKVARLLLDSAGHAETAVRLQAVYALSSGWNRKLVGGPEKLAALIDGDADAKVRQAACAYAGQLGVSPLVATYKKHTAKRDDPALYGKCLRGLVAMFHQYPLFDTAEPGAYRLFLERIVTKPRTANIPPWDVMDAFQYFGDDAKNDKLVAWKKQATWFKPAEVRTALADVIADGQANWMARTGAIASMVGLGATKAELVALKKKYDGKATGDDSHVVKRLDEAIAEAP